MAVAGTPLRIQLLEPHFDRNFENYYNPKHISSVVKGFLFAWTCSGNSYGTWRFLARVTTFSFIFFYPARGAEYYAEASCGLRAFAGVVVVALLAAKERKI